MIAKSLLFLGVLLSSTAAFAAKCEVSDNFPAYVIYKNITPTYVDPYNYGTAGLAEGVVLAETCPGKTVILHLARGGKITIKTMVPTKSYLKSADERALDLTACAAQDTSKRELETFADGKDASCVHHVYPLTFDCNASANTPIEPTTKVDGEKSNFVVLENAREVYREEMICPKEPQIRTRRYFK